METFKKHVWFYHTDFETGRRYIKSVKEIVGQSRLKRIELIFLNQLKLGELDGVVR